MDYLSQLPLECQDIIISILIGQKAFATVAALLQVNKSLASAVLPHLYADPFQTEFHAADENEYRFYVAGYNEGDNDLFRPIYALARTLLAKCIQQSYLRDEEVQVPEVVSLAFPELASPLQDDTTLPQEPTLPVATGPLDYLSHLRHLNLCTPLAYIWLYKISSPATLAYIKQEAFKRRSGIDDLLTTTQTRFDWCPPTAVLPVYYQYFRIELLREINWLLASSSEMMVLEQLQELTIPVSDIERFLEPEVMKRFKALQKVRFMVDEVLEFPQEDVDAAFEGEAAEAWAADNDDDVAVDDHDGDDDNYSEEGENEMDGDSESVDGARSEFGIGESGQPEPEEAEVVEIKKRDPAAVLLLRAKERKDAAMQNILQFVRQFNDFFPGQLQTVTCPVSDVWSPSPWHPLTQSIPNDVQFELLTLLPPLRKPKVLDESNWTQFMAHPKETYLEAVSEIKVEMNMNVEELGAVYYGRVCEERGFLQRCRMLRKLTIGSLGKGTYKWAVEEKNAALGITTGDKSKDSLLLQRNEGKDDKGLHHNLIPLEKAYITLLGTVDTDEIDDIAYAFSETLATLNINLSPDYNRVYDDPNQPSTIRTFRIGQSWVTLSNLRDLYIDTRLERLTIDRELLSHCPNLVLVGLYDDATLSFQPQDAIQGTCEPALLKHVQELSLYGWSAVTFHPGTLFSVGETLEELSVKIPCSADNECYVPPPSSFLLESSQAYRSLSSTSSTINAAAQDHQHGLHRTEGWYGWTWEWRLPVLTKLQLNSKFAYQFQFKMLNECPALKTLELNIFCGSTTDHLTRMLTRDDIYEQPTGTAEQTEKRIVAPSLQTLEMVGGWTFPGGNAFQPEALRSLAFMREFLTGVFPNLKRLVARHWVDVRLEGFLTVLRENRKDGEKGKEGDDSNGEEEACSASTKQYNKIERMYLEGWEIHDGEQIELMGLGLVAIGSYGDDELQGYLKGKVLEDVEVKFGHITYHVLKSGY